MRVLQEKIGTWQLSQIYGHQTAQGSTLKCCRYLEAMSEMRCISQASESDISLDLS